MKRIQFLILLVYITLNSDGQNAGKPNASMAEITIGTFNTLAENGNAATNPVILVHKGDYYFESRYGYEAANSASVNAGKKIFKKIKHADIVPMAGLIVGSFKGLTAELQTSLDYRKWFFTTDNQYSYEYTHPNKNLYFNWTVARYKVTDYVQIGLTTFLDKRVDKAAVFDKGATVVFLIKNWVLRFYAFNYEIEKRYYWLGLRYTFKIVN